MGIGLGVGYDSKGLETGNAKDGLYVSSTKPIATMSVGIHAGIVLNAVILRASATGGLDFTINAILNGADAAGKVRFLGDDGFYIKPDGKAKADIRVRIQIGLGPFSYSKTVPLVSIVLVDFSLSGNGKAPTSPPDQGLATLAGGELLLNTGPRAGNRILGGVKGDDTKDIEGYQIAQATDPNSKAVIPGALAISAFGVTQVFGGPGAGPVRISGNLGLGDDSLVLSADVTQAIDVGGGKGDDMIVGGAGADRIRGEDGNDYLVGNGGNDILDGGDGDDTLVGGSGADQLIGGSGTDEVTYQDAAQGVRILKIEGRNYLSGFRGEAEGDRLSGIEHLTGTRYDDELTAEDNASSSDKTQHLLEGLDGNDKLYGGNGDDLLLGGSGGDYMNGGGGRNGTSYITSSGSVVVDLGARVFYGGDANGDQLVNIQEVYGSSYNDALYGDDADNRLNGFFGNDILWGRGGKDIVEGDLGDDTIFATLDGDTLNGDSENGVVSRGTDLLSYRFAGSTGVTVNLRDGVASSQNPFKPGRDTIVGARILDADGKLIDSTGYSSFENLEGSNSGVGDSLTGDDGDNVIWGLNGNDQIFGGAGNDRLIGGLGAIGGSGDTLDGGDGIDWADYRDSAAGVTAYLDGTKGVGGTAEGDVLKNIENLQGSDQTDNLYGNAGDNVIDPGLTGNERYFDFVDGGAGTDTLRLDYSRADYGTGFSGGFFTTGDGSGYGERRDRTGNVVMDAISFANIEKLWITGTRLDDTVIGGTGADVIVTGSGADTIYAGTGDDWIDAGSGNDTVLYGTGADRGLSANAISGGFPPSFRVDGGSGFDTLSLSLSGIEENIVINGPGTAFQGNNLVLSNGSSFSNFEALKDVWTGKGSDSVTQLGNFNNDIRTGDGQDTINAGLGFDRVDGGIETAGLTYDSKADSYLLTDSEAFYSNPGDRLVVDYSSVTDAAITSSSSYDSYIFSYTKPDGFSIFSPGSPGFPVFYTVPIKIKGYFQTVSVLDGKTVTNRVDYKNIESLQVFVTQNADVIWGTDVERNSSLYRRRNDELHGGGGNDRIYGLSGSDELFGDDGDDILQGTINSNSSNGDISEAYDFDRLTGGRGADTFVFGTAKGSLYTGAFYDGKTVSEFNYGNVKDFNAAEGDKIVFYGKASDYFVINYATFGYADVFLKATYHKKNGEFGFIDIAYNDRIARIDSTNGFDLNGPGVQYIDASGVVTSMMSARAPLTVDAATPAMSASATPQAATPVKAAADPAPWITQEADPTLLQAALGLGSGVVVGSATLTIEGSGEGFGTFSGDPFGLGSGVILSTGKVTDLAGPNTNGGLAGQLPQNVQLKFVKVGRSGNSDIYRADLTGLGIDVRSLRLSDGNTRTGGSGGVASGFDLDAVVLSTTFLDNVTDATDMNSALSRLNLTDFSQSNLFFSPGTQRPPGGASWIYGYGPTLLGSINGYAGSGNALVVDAANRLSTFNEGNALTLGDGGSLAINLTQPLPKSGPLYLYIGEEGGVGEALIGAVSASSEKIQPSGDLSTDLGAPGLDGDTSRLTYRFTPIAGTDLVSFQVVLFSEELPEHAGVLDPDAVTIMLNGVSIAALSDGAAADLNVLMPSANSKTHPDLILNAPGSGPLASKVAADAYTKTLTFVGRVQAGVENTLVIEAADRRDAYLDTGILIKGGTFLSAGGALPTNIAPIAVGDTALVTYGTAYKGNVLANDFDPNGDTLKASLASGPANGTVTLAADGSFTYTPKAGFFGNDSFTYVANDGKTNGAPGSVTLVVGRPAGVTADAANPYSANEDTVLSVSADAGVLVGDETTTGKPLTAQLVSTTANGTLALKADGSFVYTPKANFSGTDSFVYRATDGTLSSANVTVQINVAPQNDAPVLTAAAPSNKLVEAGVSSSGSTLPGTSTATLLLSKSDADGNATASYDISGWTDLGGGKVSKTGLYGTAVLNTASGLVTYTLDNARNATNALSGGTAVQDGFDVTIRDTAGAIATQRASFTITGTNDAPSITAGTQSQALVETGIGSGGVDIFGNSIATTWLTMTDPDTGDVLTVQNAGWTSTVDGKLTRSGVYGTVLLDPASGLMTYILDNSRAVTNNLVAGMSVTDTFTVTVKDTAGASASTTVGFSITGTNDRPLLAAGAPSRSLVEAGTGIPGISTATVQLTKSGGASGLAFDISGWVALGGTRYTFNGTYGSVILDTATGLLNYTLDNSRAVTNDLETGDIRRDIFALSVKDSTGASASRSVTFTILGSGDGVTINGSAQADRINDTSSAPGQPRPTAYIDTIYGNDGDDVIAGLGGKDVIDGGAGKDTAVYAEKTTTVSVTLNGATNATVTVGGVAEDTIRNIENLIGGSGDDRFTGDGQDNVFSGRGGKDVLDGGAGSDTADYSEKTDAIAVTLNGATNATVTVGGVAEDTIRNIENIIGGTGNDTLVGDANANTFAGRGGKDSIDGGAGSDTADYSEKTAGISVILNGATLATVTVGGVAEDTVRNIENIIGGSGNDTLTGDGLDNTLSGNGGNDLLKGGGGKDVLDGGAGFDTADYTDKTAAVSVTLNGSTSVTVSVGGVAEDTIRNIENLIGGSAGDTLIGDGAANVLSGRSGNDVLDGGAGTDTADYAEKTTSVVVTLNGSTNATVTVGGTAEDTIRNIENLIGGSAGDTFTGDGLANTFFGRGGKDILDGGAGSDTADYSEKSASVAVTLNGATFATVTVGGTAEDTIRNIENIIGGTGADTLTGDAADNVFAGRAGKDVLDGGAGNDTADYSDKYSSVAVTLSGSTAATVSVGGVAEDTIRNIENIIGGSGNDTLTGDGLANSLFGNGGNDILRGGGGKDVLDGGGGLDTADYSDKTAAVFVKLTGSTDATVTVGGVAEDTIRNIENLIGGSGGDTLIGDGLVTILNGNDGADYLDGGFGNDTLTGGLGADRFVFSTKLDAASNVDTITDFNVAEDVIQLSQAIFSSLAAGDLPALDFGIGSSATSTAQNIVYDKTSGKLYYDADGSGAGTQVQFATLAPNLTLTAANFKVV